MNKFQLDAAYAELVKTFSLNHAQRDNLDSSDDYLEILQLVYDRKWMSVEVMLQKHNYFNNPRPAGDDPVFELVD